MRRIALVLALLALPGAAHAGRVLDNDDASLDVGGDVKGFFVGMFPYEHFLMPEDPVGQGMLDFRFKVDGGIQRWFRYSFHHQASASVLSESIAMGLSPTASSGQAVPEALDLSWSVVSSENQTISGRMDRAWIGFRVPHFNFTVGRQPISFGSAYFFTPMDLVNPFSPVVIDQEYKPGVDAARADIYIGMTGNISIVAAYAGSWDWEGTVLAAHGGFTVGVFDLGFFAGQIHAETVLGMDFKGAIGPVGVRGEGTVTMKKDQDPFVRLVLGADYRPHNKWYLIAEFYLQTLGACDPACYLPFATTDRFLRGELWTMGRYYAAFSVNWEAHPLVNVSMFVISNLADPSFLLGPALSWSVADNAEMSAGTYFALGKRPGEMTEMDFLNDDFTVKTEDELMASIPVESEFGLSPHVAYVQLKVYF